MDVLQVLGYGNACGVSWVRALMTIARLSADSANGTCRLGQSHAVVSPMACRFHASKHNVVTKYRNNGFHGCRLQSLFLVLPNRYWSQNPKIAFF